MESQATQQVPTYSFCHPLTGDIKHSHKWPPPPSAPQIPKTNRTVNPMCPGQWEVKTNGAHVPRPVQCSTPKLPKKFFCQSLLFPFSSLLFSSLLFSLHPFPKRVLSCNPTGLKPHSFLRHIILVHVKNLKIAAENNRIVQ